MNPPSQPFSQVMLGQMPLWELCTTPLPNAPSLEEVLRVQDFVHIKAGLLDAYDADYPLVEPRELIPAFDAPLIEYKHLPAFSMVLLDRPLSYQDEVFQFDLLLTEGKPSDPGRVAHNRQVMRERLPRNLIAEFEAVMGRKALTNFSRYNQLLPFLLRMDRGHVLAREESGRFHLAGVFASFPSDLDGDIKRFGRSIGKFAPGDNRRYAMNRRGVYRFLMEQLGFAISGERHTSAALFARKLMRARERFAIKVLGNSDRTITTLTSLGARHGLPRVEKVALVAATCDKREQEERLLREGFMIDPRRKTVILRVHYIQHRYHPDNVLEDRALSVLKQEIVHPDDGRAIEVDVLGLGHDRLLALNDILRGEYHGTIVYRGRERLDYAPDLKGRLKFISAWLAKHRLILADYSPDHFERLVRLMTSFLDDPEHEEELAKNPDLLQEVVRAVADLRLSHRLRLLEKLVANRADAFGRKLQHSHILIILNHVLTQEGEEMAAGHPRSLRKLLTICRKQLGSGQLRRLAQGRPPRSHYERELLYETRALTRLVEEFEARLVQAKAAETKPPARATV